MNIWRFIIFIMITMAATPLIVPAQSIEIKELLQKEISIDEIQKHPEPFMADLQRLIYHEFDSIDFDIIVGPQKDVTLVTTLLRTIAPHNKEKKTTFNSLKELIENFRKIPEYYILHEVAQARNTLINKKATLKTWEEDRQLLEKMKLSESEQAVFYNLIKKNADTGLFYSDIFAEFTQIKKAEQIQHQIEEQKKRQNYKERNQKLSEESKSMYAFNLLAYNDFEKGMKEAEKTQKPVFLCFSARKNLQAIEMEVMVISRPPVCDFLKQNYLIIYLQVSNEELLPEDEVYYSESLKQNITKKGEKWMELEKSRFQAETQPLYIILNPEGKEIARSGVLMDSKLFYEFLQKGVADRD